MHVQAGQTVTGKTVESLLEAAADQDAAAFRLLYDHTAAKLLGIASRIVRRRDLAEEVIQDVFVKIWTGAARFDRSLGSGQAYLATMTRNRALDQVRRKTEVSAEEKPDMQDLSDNLPTPEAIAEDRSELRAVLACLQRLPAGQRQAIAAAYIDGASGAEIAARLAVPVGTVKTWLSRGLAALRECMDR
jgi:RNA polymerase sigma-70 factor (ECF subfamily)